MKRIYLLLLVVVFSFSGCEKDDICDANTSTTPRLVIEVYDNTTITPTLKALTKMKAVADGMTEGVVFYPTLAAINSDRYLSNDKKIYLPLRTTDDVTKYYLTLNSGVAGSENTDVVTFNYARNTVYVSRACGYKMLFNLTNTNYFDIVTPDSDNWIKNVIIVKPNLETETDVHIQIYY